MKKPIFILSFLEQHWPLLIVVAFFTTLSHYDQITYFVGPNFYIFALIVIAIGAALFAKHISFRRSIDAYTQKRDPDGTYQFVREFWALEPALRVKLTIFTIVAFFLGACYIAAALAK